MAKHASCPWCEHKQKLNSFGATFCENCFHRADVPQSECNCRRCERREKGREAKARVEAAA